MVHLKRVFGLKSLKRKGGMKKRREEKGEGEVN